MQLPWKGFWVLLGLSLVAASSPALGGSWVYDDWGLARSDAQNGLDDLLSVFSRSSAAYIKDRSPLWPFGVTYRPLSMLSLIAPQLLLPAPWLHHAVSFALHAFSAVGLLLALRRMRGAGAANACDALACALFALHPLTIESYGWINGRSDVLAGAFLAGLACQLPFAGARSTARELVFMALCAAGAALAKEPALVAVLSLLAAALLPERGRPDPRTMLARWPAVLATLSGLLCAGLARLWVVRGIPSGAQALLGDPQLASAYASTLALALEHTLLPLPRAMLSLAVEIGDGAGKTAWGVLALAVAALLWLVTRQRWRAAVLAAGALAALLPVLPVRHMFWLGFDRYLYMPLFLLLLAIGGLLGERGGRALERPWAKAAAIAGLALLGASSFATARAYASQTAWLRSMVLSRPDDPSGWVMSASWFLREGDRARAQVVALSTPTDRIPPVISHDLADLLIELGLRAQAVAVMEQTFRVFPNRAPARFDALVARGMQGRFDDAYALARSLRADPVFCTAARSWIDNWQSQPDLPPAERPRAAALVRELRCPASPTPPPGAARVQ